MPPRTLGERGTVALFLDPEGGLFGVINSATGDPEDYLADDNQWLWIELMANDPAKMAEFYKGIGAYDVVDGAAAGESSGFRLKSGGYARAGIQAKLDQKYPTTWVPYLRVKSVADTVASASGRWREDRDAAGPDARYDDGDHRGSDRSAGRAGRVARQRQGGEMNMLRRPLLGAALALGLAALAGCESGNYGGSTSVSYGYSSGYYPGGYYPGYYPGGCCWDNDVIVVNPPDRPENRPDRPTTLPAGPGDLPSSRPSQPTTRPATSTRPTTTASRPAPRPTPRPMGGGGRRR